MLTHANPSPTQRGLPFCPLGCPFKLAGAEAMIFRFLGMNRKEMHSKKTIGDGLEGSFPDLL